MKSFKFKTAKIGLTVALLFFVLALAIFPERYVLTTKKGLSLWALTVLPSLLPYFFLTTLLTKTGVLTKLSGIFAPITKRLFRLSGVSAYAFCMSVLSGYPVGSKIVSDLYFNGLISSGEAKRLSVLCSTSGPLFIIGAVGVSMFNSKLAGFIMYLSHVVAQILTALLVRGFGDDERLEPISLSNSNADNLLYEAVYSSVISSLIVGGFVSIFYVLGEILLDFKVLLPLSVLFKPLFIKLGASSNTAALAFSVGLVEFTKGCSIISGLGLSPITASLCCCLITFSGVSVLMQSLAFLQKAKVSPAFYIASKVISAVISGLVCYFSCLVFL